MVNQSKSLKLPLFILVSSVIVVLVLLLLDSPESQLVDLELKIGPSGVACGCSIVLLAVGCLRHGTRAFGWFWLGAAALAIAVVTLTIPSSQANTVSVAIRSSLTSIVCALVEFFCLLGLGCFAATA